MTGDQRLILKIEHAAKELEHDRMLAAYHVLDDILRELDAQSRDTLHHPMVERRQSPRPPVAAAG